MEYKKYKLEVLSPLSIGDGNEHKRFEYIFDRRDNVVKIIDIIKLLESNEKSPIIDNIILAFEQMHFNWNEQLRQYRFNINDFILYKVESDTVNIKGEILSYIKTAGRPYIPGTSIKGAIRSTLTKGAFDKIGMSYKKSIDFFKDQKEKNPKKNYLKKIDDRAEEKEFGKPNNSPFRFLKISDSDALQFSDINVYEIKVLNICNGKLKWHIRNGNEEDFEKANSIFLEALKPGSIALGNFELDKRLFDDDIKTEGKIVNTEILKDFTKIIRDTVNNYIDSEINFYDKYDLTKIVEFYKGLKSIKLKDNEFLLQIGYGTGSLSKTINNNLEIDYLNKLKIIGLNISDINLYPKTRKIIFKNGRPDSVPGWIKVCLD
ncbi:type III-A CRISPR-associated RAMP protein Csm5 [Thermoanaerobacterium sp. RBIITD]|uniref:type III-A CRISPR-associated RAMP protein Csm5 n=1 Tax=Thermoanaerobacterium sp. RBIITD TaxID=1550240 RepID=UPI000BB97109|nr:type III-A CRISPR-associated RAMP protein Csm5 [Thermoanaerobacterium sp. RBIITD]SNX53619.1 CRISPR-associated protein, Csm5 family [Thermoanaerobacterium sp. RBIITD]